MEKFAVDLEKVLDEFEFSEEREERVALSVINNQSLPYISHVVPSRPPVNNYRRPSFEPINLADADFAASPPRVSRNQHNLTYSNGSIASIQNISGGNKSSNIDKFHLTSDDRLISNGLTVSDNTSEILTKSISSTVPVTVISTSTSTVSTDSSNIITNTLSPPLSSRESIISESWSEEDTSSLSDEKPDLLDCNTSKSIILNEHHRRISNDKRDDLEVVNDDDDDYNGASRLLPDVTPSVLPYKCLSNQTHQDIISLDNDNSSNNAPVFDLISNNFNNCNLNNYSCTSDTKDNEIEPDSNEADVDNIDSTVQIADTDDVVKISDDKLVCDDVAYKDNESIYGKDKNFDISNNDPPVSTSSEVVEENNSSSIGLGDRNDEKDSFSQSNNVAVDPEILSDASITFSNTKSESSNVIQDNYDDNTSISLKPSNEEVDSEANVSVLVEPSLPDLSKQPVGFALDDSCDDSDELERYLEELEELEKSQDINSSVKVCDPDFEVKKEVLPDQSVSRTFERLSSQESDSDKETFTVTKVDDDVNRYCNAETTLKSNEITENIENNVIESNLVKEVGHSQVIDDIESLNDSNDFDDDLLKVNYRRNSKDIDDSVNQLNSFMKDSGDNYFINSDRSCLISDGDNALNTIIDDSKSIADVQKHISDQCERLISGEVSLSGDDFHNKIEDIETVDTMGNSVDKVSTSIGNHRPEDVIGPEEVTNTVSLSDDNITVITSEPHLSQEQQRSSLESLESRTDDGDVSRISRPNYLELPAKITVDPDGNTDEAATPSTSTSPSSATTITSADGVEVGNDSGSPLSCGELSSEECQLGKVPPFWVPDSEALTCMQCQQKFTLVKRRHHCRACGQVLCSKCCCMRTKLVFMEGEAKVCQPCYNIIGKANSSENKSPLGRQPNPNNPMEYCSTIPPLQQAAGSLHQPPPSVLVPVGVLKREGRGKSEVAKQVMFSDGIRPGGDLTELDGSGEPRLPFRRPGRLTKRVGTPPGGAIGSSGSMGGSRVLTAGSGRQALDPITQSFIPSTDGKNGASLPPIVDRVQGENVYSQFDITFSKGVKVDDEKPIKFAINANLFVLVKRVLLDCCVNRECWCVTSSGLACVGQDEVILVLECLPDEIAPPKDVFLLINTLYIDASKGNTVSELSFSPSFLPNLLDSKDHGGFLYVRPSYQCTSKLILPSPPYLVALLIHKWETPWARLFPIRLVLRLGAEYRYYPCPLVSIRHRQPLYTDIGHTIINILADFRKYSYTLPTVRGLVVHMEDRQTTILLPRNRYDQVVRALNNSNDSVLAFGANLSLAADSHLVCIQSSDDENTYHTQAINIHNKPRRVTGASFVVFNGALKASCGLSGKSSIVEDGLMVQVPGDTMTALRTALRDMRDYTIRCGPHAEETVLLRWTADDTNFNIGVKSCIDGRLLDGVPSMRVHNGTDYSGQYRIIRWTEVFILQCEEVEGSGDPLDISRLSESLARATCLALVPYLDLLATANLNTIGVRAVIHPDHVGYEAGSNCEKLPPLYMNSLDNELVAVVHQAAVTCQDTPCTLELVFRVMES